MKAPTEPEYSCPNLDEAISEIEKARKIHDDLRKWGTWWQERCDELETEHAREINDKDDEIKSLTDKIDELRDQIKQLERQVCEVA